MGHEVSQEVPLDPDLEAEYMLLDLVPQLMDELLRGHHFSPQPQSTSALTGHAHVEEILTGNIYTFRNVTRMNKATFHRLVNLMRGLLIFRSKKNYLFIFKFVVG